MNILPTGPDNDHDPNWDRYFTDLRRWNFDVAYNAFYAFRMDDVNGKYARPYHTFAERAKKEGVPSCVQIQSVVAHLDDLPLSETQRYIDNEYYLYEHYAGLGKKFHFASFASQKWLDYLKNLTTRFREFGFEWVVYEEPMLHTDIPGTEDPFHRLFQAKFPGVKYPTHHAETREYLLLQQLKRDTLVGFYTELAAHAKSMGFQKVGIMPWFFTPTLENTPTETWNTNCDTGRLTFIPDVDIIVVRMQPDNIYAQVMASATGESTPVLSYYECLAHNLGKDIIMVNNPTDEHRPEANRASTLIPYPFFQRYTLAVAAAAPQGMSRHWYGKNYDEDSRHMDLVAKVNALLRRLAPAVSPVAFVFSFMGGSHVWPRPWRETWRSYWTFAQQMIEEEHLPFLTFFAETLRESLQRHPDTRVIVLHDFYPIPPEEIAFLEQWVKAAPDRHLVYLGGHDGYSWNLDVNFQQFRLRPPEMAELFGIDTSKSVELCYLDPEAEAKLAAGADPVLDAGFFFGASSCTKPVFRPEANVEVLYRSIEQEVPVVTRRRFASGGNSWFLGITLDGARTYFPFRELFDSMIRDFSPVVEVLDATQNVFFNTTQNGYFVAANCSAQPGKLEIASPFRAYDVSDGRLVKMLKQVKLDPFSIALYRIAPDDTLVLDVANAITIRGFRQDDNTVEITGMFHREIEVVCAQKPKQVFSGCGPLSFTSKRSAGLHRVAVRNVPSGESVITVAFD